MAVATANPTAAPTDRTVPVLSASQNTIDATMTGTTEAGENQTPSSIPSKRKSTASGPAEKKGQTHASSKPKGARFTVRNPPWAYLHLELYGTPPRTQHILLCFASIHLTLPPSNYRVTQPTPSSSAATPSQTPLDHLTARSYLTSALSQFLGLTGTSTPVDILKLDTESKNSSTGSLWIRVPNDDLAAVTAALSSWIGGGSGSGAASISVAFRIRDRGSWLGALVGGRGEDLFS
ncbi:hypothetical protein FQN54_007498 [Arachnomyces sp. PD_36]|nr:hypothetical protein FQN54_007498 [Arachnomyces sp. PD_36]